MILIGFHGKSESGKSTASDILIDRFEGFEKLAFAGPLKDTVSLLYGIDRKILDTQEGKKALSPVKFKDLEYLNVSDPPDHYLTNRELLQVTADTLRAIFPNIFVNALERDFMNRHLERLVIEDVRYDNEAQMIREHGGFIIQVERPGNEIEINHSSEEPLNHNYIDHILYNTGDMQDYKKQTCDRFVELTGIER